MPNSQTVHVVPYHVPWKPTCMQQNNFILTFGCDEYYPNYKDK